MKKIISLLTCLVIILSSLMLSSCGLIISFPDPGFPPGYTGGMNGFTDYSGYPHVEIYWVETYDECKTAIEKLSSHGSKFHDSVVFDYEGDLFDVKYCFRFTGDMDFVKYGEYPFDRYAQSVTVKGYAFFEDVTIDELVFSHLNEYKIAGIWNSGYETIDDNEINKEDITYQSDGDGGYIAYYKESELFRISKNENTTDECIEAIKNSITFVSSKWR